MVIILTVFIFLMSSLFEPLLLAFAGDFPPWLRMLILISVQVILLTYVIMPFVTSVLERWLFSSDSKRSKN